MAPISLENSQCVWGTGDEYYGESVQPGWYAAPYLMPDGSSRAKVGPVSPLYRLSVYFGTSEFTTLKAQQSENTPSILAQCKPAHNEYNICENIQDENRCVRVTGCSW